MHNVILRAQQSQEEQQWSECVRTLSAAGRLPSKRRWAGLSSDHDWKFITYPFQSLFRRKGSVREVFPIPCRIQRIGYEMGENNRTPAWNRANHRAP